MEEDEKNMLWGNMPCMQSNAPSHMQPPPMMRRPDSSDDRHVIAKHGQIYPTDEQLASIQKQVSTHKTFLQVLDFQKGWFFNTSFIF